MRILIADDHEVVRKGVRSLLLTRPDLNVCGEATDGRDAFEKAAQLKPDVIVMDVSMPRLNGLEATRLIRESFPDTEVLILSQHDSPELIRQAFTAGARGYVTKSCVGRHLLSAVNVVSRHESFVTDPNEKSPEVSLREVLERDAALEEALRNSEERFRSSFELAAVGVAHLDPDGRWIRVNSKFAEILGFAPADLLEFKFQELTHPEDLVDELPEHEKILEGSSDQYSIEKRYRRRDESFVWVSHTVSSVREENGKVKYLIAVIEDITARKRTVESLREKQELLRAAFAQTYSFFLLLKTDGTILEANRAMLEATGYSRSEVLGRPVWEPWWSYLPQEQKILKASLSAAVKGIAVREECSYCLRDGTVRFADRTLNPVQNSRGDVIMIVASGLDITEQKHLRERLEDHIHQRATELEYKNKELERQNEIVRELSTRLLQIQHDEIQ